MSPRYAPTVCVLVAVALVPTLIHNYAGVVIEDGRSTAAVGETLAGFTSTKSDRSATWGQRRFESNDWLERRYVSGANEATLTIIRSFDLKALYHHPELAVAYGSGFTKSEVRYLDEDTAVPVFVLSNEVEGGPVAMYVLHYGNTFVAEPIRFQIRTAGELLFSGRRQMTLFFAQGRGARTADEASDVPWKGVLFAAIREFVSAAPAVPQEPRPTKTS